MLEAQAASTPACSCPAASLILIEAFSGGCDGKGCCVGSWPPAGVKLPVELTCRRVQRLSRMLTTNLQIRESAFWEMTCLGRYLSQHMQSCCTCMWIWGGYTGVMAAWLKLPEALHSITFQL